MRDKIFKIIWDINGALFLLLLLALGGLMSFELVTGLMKSDTPPVRVNLAEDEKGKENWQLGYPESITGYDLYFIPLESDNRQVETEVGSATADFVANSRFRKFFTPTKNIVFVNSITNQSYWMFPENNQFILDTEQIVVTAADSPGANDSVTKYTRAISYRVSSQDTNGDNRVDKADKPSFALSRHDGSDFKTIIKNYEKIVSTSMNDNQQYFVIYVKNSDVYSMLVDLETLDVISNHKLPKVPQDAMEKQPE